MRCKHITAALLTCGLFAFALSPARAEPTLKALIVDGQNNHHWQATTPLIKKALEDSKLFTVDVATSPAHGVEKSDFRPKFADYNVVVLNYNGELWPAETRKDFVDYVAGGGGMVSVHAADNSFPSWKEYNEMIGLGGWGGRNEKDGPYVYWKEGDFVHDTSKGSGGAHGAQFPFLLEVRKADHPITQGLPEKFRHAPDELYSLLRGPAKNLTVLATAYSAPKHGGTGRNEPILMTIDYGKGRVFHTTIGKVTQAVPADFPGEDQPKSR
jgi:type 1 glutamine amidotransferase